MPEPISTPPSRLNNKPIYKGVPRPIRCGPESKLNTPNWLQKMDYSMANILMAKFFECKFKPGKRQPLCKSTTFTKLVHCTQGQPVMSFITTVQQIAAQLTDLQSPVTDLQVMSKILMSLPPSYRHFLSAWDSVPTAEKTIALLTSRLLKEEKITSIHNQGQPDANDMAYLTGFQTQPCKNR